MSRIVNRMAIALRAASTTAIELVLPTRCVACNDLVDPTGIFCPICEVSVLPVGPCCLRCGVPDRAPLCIDCAAHPAPFVWTRSAHLYGGEVRTAIARLKYSRHSYLAKPLARLMRPVLRHALTSSQPPTLVVPVPLHRRQLVERGFNQSALLARNLARWLELPLSCRGLIRERDTGRQVGRSRPERQRHVAGAFRVIRRRVEGAHVLLVDDVITTGATARACASSLLSAGAQSVAVATVARAVD